MLPEQAKFSYTSVKRELCRGLSVLRNPAERKAHIQELFIEDGIPVSTVENPRAAYCAMGLSNVPDAFKPKLKEWQLNVLGILKAAGFDGHDTSTAPEAPDINPTIPPTDVYRIDEARVARHRIFTFLNIFASTGAGIEQEIAKKYNQIAVVLHHKNIGVSTMQPDRAIHLQFSDLEQQRDRFIQAFSFLSKFEPGQGFDNQGKPILLGYRGNKYYNLPELVYAFFPDLKYNFDPNTQMPKYTVTNPEIFT